MPQTVDMDALTSLIESEKLFLLDIHAGWCHPCKLLDREIEALEKISPNLDIFKIDYDLAEGLSDQIGIRALPLLVLFQGGKEILRIKGFQKSEKILAQIREATGESGK